MHTAYLESDAFTRKVTAPQVYIVTPRIMSYCRDRLFEWVMTITMLGMALELVIWPGTIAASSFYYILRIISPENMAIFFFVFGGMRIAALLANGHWPRHGPRLRAMGAGAAAIMWGQMGTALFIAYNIQGSIPSPGMPIYTALVLGELFSAYRAIHDERS